MNIGIIDADFIGKKNHRFPNLALMKISSYHKNNNDNVSLLSSYDDVTMYDKVYLSKVFTDTYVPDEIISHNHVNIGGTGFFYDKAPALDNAIEHCKPDYSLYDGVVGDGVQYKYYRDYSIGFTTRGCYRHCDFCVNRNSNKSAVHSPINEFLDESKKKICLLDDNVFACRDWEHIFNDLNETGKRFQYKQGLDERLLDDRKCQVLFNSNYDGEYIFAFDNVEDYSIIRNKLDFPGDILKVVQK